MNKFIFFITLLSLTISCSKIDVNDTNLLEINESKDTKAVNRSNKDWVLKFSDYLKNQRNGMATLNAYTEKEVLTGIAELHNRVNVKNNDKAAKILKNFKIEPDKTSPIWELDMYNQVYDILETEIASEDIHSFSYFSSTSNRESLIFGVLVNNISKSVVKKYADDNSSCGNTNNASLMRNRCMVFCDGEYYMGAGGHGETTQIAPDWVDCPQCGEEGEEQFAMDELEPHINNNLPECSCPNTQTIIGYEETECTEVYHQPWWDADCGSSINGGPIDVIGYACDCWTWEQMNCFYCEVLDSFYDEYDQLVPEENCILSVDMWTKKPDNDPFPDDFVVVGMTICHAKPICSGLIQEPRAQFAHPLDIM